MIESYLHDHYIIPENESPKPYNSYFEEGFLMRCIATAKLFGGADQVKWCSHLPSGSIQELKERVSIDFLECNRTKFAVNEPVILFVSLKNVTQLITKVNRLLNNPLHCTHPLLGF